MSVQVVQAEAAITQAMVDGSLEHPRLQRTLERLDRGRLRLPLTAMRQALAHSSAATAAEGLHDILGPLHRCGLIDAAHAQVLALGFYRLMWRLLARLDRSVTIDDLRRLPPAHAAQVCYGFTFGHQPVHLPLPATLTSRMYGTAMRFLEADGIDREWREDGPLPLGAPLVTVCDRDLSTSANAIRNTFFAEVFTQALLEQRTVAIDDVLLVDVLFAADVTPERIGFLRRLPPSQARFRLRQLALAVIALHHQASVARCGMGVPMREVVIASLLAPFVSLRGWLKAHRDRLWIPVVRMMPDGEPLISQPDLLAAGQATTPAAAPRRVAVA
jgi:hypothetical protein